MAEQMAERPKTLCLDEPLECCAITLLDGTGELRDQLLVRRKPNDRFRERAGVGLCRSLGRRRAAQEQAAEDTLLDPDPFTDEAAPGRQLEAREDCLERLPILGAEGLVRGCERLRGDGQPTDRPRFLEKIAEHIELEALVCHHDSPSVRRCCREARRSSVTPP